MRTARSLVLAFVLLGSVAIIAAGVSAAAAHRVRGTIASVSADTVVVTGRDGKPVTVKTNSATRIVGRAAGHLADIKSGDTVTVVAKKAQDGSLTALTVQDVPSGLQVGGGARAGQRELKSGKVMVNGRVVSAQGNTLSIASTDAGATTVTVPEGARIRRVTPLSLSNLTPGAHVAVQGTDNPDGTVTATFIMVEGAGPR